MKNYQKSRITIATIVLKIQAVRIYSEHIGIEFGIEKRAILIMRSGKKENGGRNRTNKPGKY